MGKTEHQKLKILYILELLYEQTDEKHAVRMRDIIAYLNQKGISAERKSIYRDLEMLQDFGVDILREQEYRGGYYIGSRDFELAELKLLVDAVQSSKFITQKKSRELIHKLEKLVSVYEAKTGFSVRYVVTNRNKTINENIYYNIEYDLQQNFRRCKNSVSSVFRGISKKKWSFDGTEPILRGESAGAFLG